MLRRTAALVAVTASLFLMTDAQAQSVGGGTSGSAVGAATGTGTFGNGIPAAPSVPSQAAPGNSTVFPPVENTVPGSQGNVVFPPVESITGAPGAGQTVFPPAESAVPGGPGELPFTTTPGGSTFQPNIFSGTDTGFIEPGTGVGTLTGDSTIGVGAQTGTTGTQLLNQNLLQPQSGGQGARVAPVMPSGTGPGSRPGDPDWVAARIDPFDPDEPDALDYSRSP